MTLHDVVRDFGQLFIMAFDGPVLTPEVAEFFREFRIGGVILFADNYRDPGQLRELISELQERCADSDLPLFVTTDHEGGRVQRFRTGFTDVPAMCRFGRGELDATRAVHTLMARELAAVGINLDFAPVADLAREDAPGAIGGRAFGDDPELVARHVAAAVQGLRDGGMLACVKHFPGHGSTTVDSHRDLPVVELRRDQLDARDLIPFRAAIAAGVPAVMNAHVLYPVAGDDTWPASLSPHWITRVLREELEFDGLIVTDAIEMKALLNHWSATECGQQALLAGADLLIYYRESFQFSAFYELRRMLEDGAIDPAAIVPALRRVRAAKERYLTGRQHRAAE